MKKIACLFACLLTGTVNATVIDFNSNPDHNYWNTPISSNGFDFSDITGEGSLGTARNLDSSSVDNGTVHLMDWNNGHDISSFRMQASDSSLFDLYSFDFTSGYLNGGNIASELSVIGYDFSGTAVASAEFTSADYNHLLFTTLTVGNAFQDMQYVIFQATGYSNRVGFDNIVVDEAPTNVPEPFSVVLLGLGLLGLGLSRKK